MRNNFVFIGVFIVMILCINCQNNHTKEVSRLTERVAILEDSIKRIHDYFYIFKTIKPHYEKIDEDRDSITLQLMILGNEFMIGDSKTMLNATLENNSKAKVKVSGRDVFLKCFRDDIEIDTINFELGFSQSDKKGGITFPYQIIVKRNGDISGDIPSLKP